MATILRDYLAKQQGLPGIRSGSESLPWPSTQSLRPTASSSANNGGDYVATRRSLLNLYAAQWLLALHDQGPAVFAKLLYDLTAEIAENAVVTDVFFLGEQSVEAETVILPSSSIVCPNDPDRNRRLNIMIESFVSSSSSLRNQ